MFAGSMNRTRWSCLKHAVPIMSLLLINVITTNQLCYKAKEGQGQTEMQAYVNTLTLQCNIYTAITHITTTDVKIRLSPVKLLQFWISCGRPTCHPTQQRRTRAKGVSKSWSQRRITTHARSTDPTLVFKVIWTLWSSERVQLYGKSCEPKHSYV
jgi:hypothetical protein